MSLKWKKQQWDEESSAITPPLIGSWVQLGVIMILGVTSVTREPDNPESHNVTATADTNFW